ncbi:GntR family transcriptional regulator [Aureibaculum algae]|uniref:GntR family transcriptional regulator n=1 Tax=Aureibaculum algae TaxID=2584122 RepID=A0A5B7TYI7_9FLAO|nr:GntR family transcriptional regulator [Aureibaculum algae]QCX40371.1 GntR family transcriptional regulator [Aureibaculum algae]
MIIIENKIKIPKYKQIVNSIEELIISGLLKKGDQIPSINKIKTDNNLSRDTVLTALNELKNRGIIQSIVGKGYYVSSENIEVRQKVFLLFDELNSFKEDLYNSFLEYLGNNVQVEIYFHHFNKNSFRRLIEDNAGNYNYYVIMPANMMNTNDFLKMLPSDRVYILDQIHEDLSEYPAIYQNFEKIIFDNLNKAYDLIKKYEKIILVFSEDKQPQGMLKGFREFCESKTFNYEIINDMQDKNIEKSELFIIPDDMSLLKLIKKMKQKGFVLAKDVGVISYNDTLLKEIVEGGITTISTDFDAMGKRLAEMILNKERIQIENPHHLIIRNSL